jgi:hypothetical protein
MGLICAIVGHKYEARYSNYSGPPTLTDKSPRFTAGEYSQLLEASKERKEVYICDVCTRCGTVLRTVEEGDIDLSDLNAQPSVKPKVKRSVFQTVHHLGDKAGPA